MRYTTVLYFSKNLLALENTTVVVVLSRVP